MTSATELMGQIDDLRDTMLALSTLLELCDPEDAPAPHQLAAMLRVIAGGASVMLGAPSFLDIPECTCRDG